MAFPKFKIADDDGNVADVQSNRLDVNAHLSTTDSTVLDNIKSALDTIKVDTEAIETAVEGTLTTSTAITSIVPGVGPLNLGKQEDTAHSSGDLGVQMLAVRKGTPADLSNADGDYEPLQVDNGRLWTDTNVSQTVHPAGLGEIDSYGRVDVPTSIATIAATTGKTESSAKEIIIQAGMANTASFCVGDSETVHEANGIVMQPGDTLILPIADISTIYWDASTSSQKAFVTIIK